MDIIGWYNLGVIFYKKLVLLLMTASSAFLDEFRIIETLGSGYTGEVLLGESNGQKFAIKKYKA